MLPYRDSRFIRITLIVFFVLAAGYALYEAQGLLSGPIISIPNETVTIHEEFTTIRGRAERISELRLNGKPISVTEEGEFEESYLAAPGSNRIILEARDARGRKSVKTLDVVYIPETN
ncbi:hypothetical protein A3A38_02290 [Candidatus Kaiserbacteria bacterium RIFCSPLOWO2_01_FULL_53_17]|uniref:Bacterial Ig domain-containing protein n=1 Tax=Candidatus Kaiserbacteria bacterium RIFCSPLOWO2_01_FULL_53_17 TaxID=1798511 RepID=A0A1F6EFX0_9BACT|nr:MAG: hypothetical protein A3A38_02290 [Candidatus Kaiserbacteria bacterium RIFCSPLOWO2_01_FULL_53_17]